MLQRDPDYRGRSDGDSPEKDSASKARWITLGFAVLILTPSMIGFVMKFSEFIHTFQSDTRGAFAITPIVNYMFASLGFFTLLLWAARNGAFKDMEAPKHTMLERELLLDDDQRHPASGVTTTTTS